MSASRTGRRGRDVRGKVVLAAIGALAACADDAGNATAPVDVNARVASLSINAVNDPVLTGDTVRLVAVARDDAGRLVQGATVTWSSEDASLATVRDDGLVTGGGHGAVTVTARAGRARAAIAVPVQLTTEARRFGYAWVQHPSSSSPYRPAAANQHNATGGGVVVTRQGPGTYVITFERMAKVDAAFRETVLVTATGASGERCHLDGWHSAPNGRDLDVSISCYTFAGARVDSRFSVLVVGSQTLPSRLGFTVTGDAAESFAAQARHTFSSFSPHVGVSRSTAGSYLVQWNGALDEMPQHYLVSTYGGPDDLCKVSSWNGGVWASVICYAPSGALRDARFSLLTLAGGRAGRRFGFAWANEPSLALGTRYTPSRPHQQTSSGESVQITHAATGSYHVSFPGLARLGGHSETVQVSPYGGGLFTCQVQGWGNAADDSTLEATVRCWNRGTGAPADTYFTILVLE